MADLHAWRDEWDLSLSAGRLAAGSREEYLLGVDQHLAWLASTHPEIEDVEQITTPIINEWMAHLVGLGRAASTRRGRLVAVKLWLKYIVSQDDSPIATNPASGIAEPKAAEKLVPVLADDELTALLDACRGKRVVDYRDTLIVRLLLDTGCRRGELAAVDLEHVDRQQHQMVVTGKGNRQRIVPYGASTAIALSKYLRARARRYGPHHPAASHPALLISTRPGRGTDWRLTGEGIYVIIKTRAERAGLGHRWPHMLRHTWAHDMKAAGVSNEDLETLGGWKEGSPVVRRYGKSMAQQRARDTARRLSRGDRV